MRDCPIPSPTRRRAALLVVSAALAGAASPALAELQIGRTAPDFTLGDSNGKPVQLASLKGRTVVIEWTNPDCPYVNKHYGTGNMQALQREAAAANAAWLTVTSALPGKSGYVNELEANAWVEKQKASPAHVVMDSNGTVADLYGVKLALHMFVVDPAGNLAYAGAIDDRPTSKPADVKGARNFVRDALAAVAAGRPMQPASTRPYGCFAR